MSKFKNIAKSTYVYVILALFYVPLFVMAVFSFNAKPKRGDVSFQTWNHFTTEGYSDLVGDEFLNALVNTLIIGLIVAIFVVIIGLMTSYGLWKQRRKFYRAYVEGTSNIYLINPDVISALGLFLTFGILFGSLTYTDVGMYRAIVAQIVVILPFAITLMYPKSEKFSKSLIEASKDLGFGPFKTWMNTYLRHMMGISVAAFAVALALSMDDFIITSVTSNVVAVGGTLGINMYDGNIENWTLALGTILLAVTLIGSSVYIAYKYKKDKKVVTK